MFLTKFAAVFSPFVIKNVTYKFLKIILGSWASHIETANWPAKTSELSDNTNWTMLKDGICTTDKVFPTFAEVNEWAASDLTMIQGKESCRLKKQKQHFSTFFRDVMVRYDKYKNDYKIVPSATTSTISVFDATECARECDIQRSRLSQSCRAFAFT